MEDDEQKVDEDTMRSVTSQDFNIDDFVPKQPAPTAVSTTTTFAWTNKQTNCN